MVDSCLDSGLGIGTHSRCPYIRHFSTHTMSERNRGGSKFSFRCPIPVMYRNQFMPTLQDMADLLDQHGVPFEWPTDSEYEARYPKIGDASKEMLTFMLRSHTYIRP